MSDLRTAALRLLEAYDAHDPLAVVMEDLRAALAESVEPVARECRDPMCACRGGPCVECEEGKREKEIEDLRSSLYFYRRRCEALQSWQSKMRDPERTIVCDILANGKTLDAAFAGDRYTLGVNPVLAKPFGYFRAEPFGWTDCAPTDEGAIPLYERPQQPSTPPEVQTEAEKVAYCAGWWAALEAKREPQGKLLPWKGLTEEEHTYYKACGFVGVKAVEEKLRARNSTLACHQGEEGK